MVVFPWIVELELTYNELLIEVLLIINKLLLIFNKLLIVKLLLNSITNAYLFNFNFINLLIPSKLIY